MLELAHHGWPDAPVWEGVDEFCGYAETRDGNILDPAAMQHQASQLGAKAEVLKQGRKARAYRSLATPKKDVAAKKGAKGSKEETPANP